MAVLARLLTADMISMRPTYWAGKSCREGLDLRLIEQRSGDDCHMMVA